MSVLNVIQHNVCQEKVIQEYQLLLCWEKGVRLVLSAIHHSEQATGRLRSEHVTPSFACRCE